MFAWIWPFTHCLYIKSQNKNMHNHAIWRRNSICNEMVNNEKTAIVNRFRWSNCNIDHIYMRIFLTKNFKWTFTIDTNYFVVDQFIAYLATRWRSDFRNNMEWKKVVTSYQNVIFISINYFLYHLFCNFTLVFSAIYLFYAYSCFAFFSKYPSFSIQKIWASIWKRCVK